MTFTIEELRFAWLQVRLGTKNAGVDGITLDFFASMVNDQLQTLQDQLQLQLYQAYPAKGFYIPKKSGGKRLVGIPTVRDRIVQRFLLEDLYFPLEDTFLDCSYAYRPGHNIQQAVQHLFSYYQLRPTWIIKADIQQFFDNLCWALLFTDLEELKLESHILELLEQQIKAGVVIAGKTIFSGKGVLQGAVLSGALANLYLTEFDRLCLSHGINLYLRRS